MSDVPYDPGELATLAAFLEAQRKKRKAGPKKVAAKKDAKAHKDAMLQRLKEDQQKAQQRRSLTSDDVTTTTTTSETGRRRSRGGGQARVRSRSASHDQGFSDEESASGSPGAGQRRGSRGGSPRAARERKHPGLSVDGNGASSTTQL